jgi:hypothetical protein
MREKVTYAVDTARPYVERIAQDEELHDHVKNAYASARTVYDQLLGGRGATGAAMRVAHDKDIQDELRSAVEELRKAGGRVQSGGGSHTKRNVLLLLTGITLGVLFNPKTGPETRKWLKDKVLGPEQPFEYQSNEN